jgi:hypothetical protein
MENQDKKFPFPQANDFNKVIKLLNTNEEQLTNKKILQEVIDVSTERQVQYYISACQFLGLIDENCKFTNVALKIRQSCFDNKIISLSRLIVSTPVFGEVFFKKYIYNEDSSKDEIAQLISDLWESGDGFAVCYRRAGTVKKWLEWIEKNGE